MSVIGLDLGTTACKAIAVNRQGSIIANASIEYTPVKTKEGYVELDPVNVWECVKIVLRQIAGQTDKDPAEALSISALGDTITPLDSQFNPTYNSLLAFDNRSVEETNTIGRELGKEWLFQKTGMPLHTSYSAFQILWLKNKKPSVFSQTKKFLCYEDYIFAKLGLKEPVISYADAGRTMLFNLKSKKWQPEILSVCGIDASYLAKPVQSGTPVGKINPSVARDIGFSQDNIILVSGGHDQTCGALGSDVYKQGSLLDSMGTVECLVMSFDQPVLKEKMMDSDLCCYAHCYPDKYVSIGMILTGGASFGWYKNQFGFEDGVLAKKNNRNIYEEMISKFKPEPSRLFFIPHLSGSGTPRMNPRAKGTLYGLTLGTDKYDIGKSVLEGLNFEIKLNIDIIESLGISKVKEIKCISGGARSAFWLQLKADILNKTVLASEFADAPVMGAAILAGYGAGFFNTLSEGIAATTSKWRSFYPDEKRVAQYQSHYQDYCCIRDLVSENLYQ
mgnify:CR=1 FL=1